MSKRKEGAGIIEISGCEYKLRYVNNLKSEDGTKLDGFYRQNRGEILLDTGMTARRSRVVELHEIVHGILEHAGLGNINGDQQECICDALAYGLISAKKNGKRLIR